MWLDDELALARTVLCNEKQLFGTDCARLSVAIVRSADETEYGLCESGLSVFARGDMPKSRKLL